MPTGLRSASRGALSGALLLAVVGAASPAHAAEPGGRDRDHVHGVVDLAFVTESGALPDAGFGLALAAGTRFYGLRLVLEGTAFLPNETTPSEGASASFRLLTGALLGCADAPAEPVLLLGCAGYEIGQLSGEGRGVTRPLSGSVAWRAARVELGAALPTSSPLRLFLRFGGEAIFERRDFILDGQTVHRAAPLGARLLLGGEFEF